MRHEKGFWEIDKPVRNIYFHPIHSSFVSLSLVGGLSNNNNEKSENNNPRRHEYDTLIKMRLRVTHVCPLPPTLMKPSHSFASVIASPSPIRMVRMNTTARSPFGSWVAYDKSKHLICRKHVKRNLSHFDSKGSYTHYNLLKNAPNPRRRVEGMRGIPDDTTTQWRQLKGYEGRPPSNVQLVSMCNFITKTTEPECVGVGFQAIWTQYANKE